MDWITGVFTVIGQGVQTFFGAVEATLARYPTLINSLSAGGTLAAVILSLYLLLRENKPNIKAATNISRIVPGGPGQFEFDDCPQVLTVSITNFGPQSVHFEYVNWLAWKIPFHKAWLLYMATTNFRAQPMQVDVGSRAIVIADDINALIDRLCQTPNVRLFRKWRLANIQLYINTTTGHTVKTRLDKGLREMILEHFKNTQAT